MLQIRSILLVLKRGARRRCPQCGIGRLFQGYYKSNPDCPNCRLEFEPEEGGTWAFMYMSTAFITGLFFLGMFLVRPVNTALWRCIVLVADVAAIVGTLPHRKGLAIGLEYLVDLGMRGPRGVELRSDEKRGERPDATRDAGND